jgi:hypothetical protein
MSAAETATPLQRSRAAIFPADTSANTQFDLLGHYCWIRQYLSAPNPPSSPEYGKGPASNSHVTSPLQDAENIWQTFFLLSAQTSLRCNALISEDGRIPVAFPVAPAISATVPARDLETEARFKAAFQRAREERFEDGMESEFSNELESLVETYGSTARNVLARLLEDEGVSARVWGEAMRSLGRSDDRPSREARLWVLEKGLTSSSAFVRDGAALGLASMDDPSAIPYLQRAISSEKLEGLRADMQEVLLQLTRQ